MPKKRHSFVNPLIITIAFLVILNPTISRGNSRCPDSLHTSNQNKLDPVIWGEVLYDEFKIDGVDGGRVLGGAPFNVASHLQRFGGSPQFVSRVGQDSLGKNIISISKTWGLDTRNIQIDNSAKTGTVQVEMNGKDHRFVINKDAAYDFIDPTQIGVKNPTLIYHGSLALRSPAAKVRFNEFKTQYPESKIFLDINLRAPWWSKSDSENMIQNAHWLKLNNEELDIVIEGQAGIEQKAKALFHKNPWLEILFVTLGADGAFAIKKGNLSEIYHVKPTENINIVDTVGAGDAFTAILILGIENSWDLQTTLDRAQVFASTIVGVKGATVPDPQFYEPLKKKWGL